MKEKLQELDPKIQQLFVDTNTADQNASINLPFVSTKAQTVSYKYKPHLSHKISLDKSGLVFLETKDQVPAVI